MKKPLIIIAGPTASGKTSLSVELAKRINGEIISADSMQVYRYMNIGTAKVSKEEEQGIKHHLIDMIDPKEPFNIRIFQQKAKKAIDEILEKGKIPILVGGTGFYIQAILYDISFEETQNDNSYRWSLEKLASENGNEYLHSLLKEVDEESYKIIHPNNVKRVIRALEYFHQTGSPISKHNEEEKKKTSPYNFLFYMLDMDRQILYNRIDTRVDEMFEKGLVQEVSDLRDRGYTKELVSMQGLGYKEVFSFFDGKCDLEEAKYIIKRDTRHFAKRQFTWFRREKDICWLNLDLFEFNIENILSKIIKDIEEKQFL
ncbi:MAG: tRNA (adenosine(37)-N6)-dimethylallyltransferase MiaA [Firmicutes bacterium HGW-Firmicutes-1]|jgi:tRNA dimethylallyltransferase|nr:MAG: tRNA (adenosine(37)-N6)-dimethylallyltransferase MiaA [Firmicutes bacterium HGW-Firmicutes-1]